MIRIPIRFAFLLLALACAVPAAAQGGRVPHARMEAFIRALRVHPQDTLRAFFPRDSIWTWVLTTHLEGEGDRVGRWRFETAELPTAIDDDGPLCRTFTAGGDAIPLESLAYAGSEESGRWPAPWRRAGASRFVPWGASARSSTFVQWRREGNRWVIDSFGNELSRGGHGPTITGPNPIVPDRGEVLTLPMPADAPYAAGTKWYEENETVVRDGERLIKYGQPRRIVEPLRRYGFVNGVAVYVDAHSRGRPDVVYVPVTPGVFQPYEDTVGTGCSESGV